MRKGFTLIELLAATALAALLLAAVFQVVGSFARSQAVVMRQDATIISPAAIEVIRQDLSHASEISSANGTVTLTSTALIDPQSSSITHRPVQVSYSAVTLGGRKWLVRRQEPLEGGDGSRELVCPDLISIEAIPVSAEAGRTAQLRRPDRVRLVLKHQTARMFEEVMVIR